MPISPPICADRLSLPSGCYREENSFRHIAMVVKFLDENKVENVTLKLFQFIQFLLIFKCWRNFLRLYPKGPYLSVEKEKEKD